MKSVRRLSLVLCVLVLGCSSEGGPVGTGISSSSAAISGNVIDVQTDTATAARAAAAALPPITIHISIDEVPGIATTADADGNFELTGAFSGALTLRFTLPQFQVTEPLDVPAGSAVVLQDIELRPDGVDTQAVRELDFNGHVDLVDCADNTLLVSDRHKDMQFMIRLIADTSIVSSDGQAATCPDIRQNDTIDIDGQVQPDRTITAVTITLAPPTPPSGPAPDHQLAFFGNLAAINCDAGAIVIDDSVQRTRIHLSHMTNIVRPDRTSLQCSDLRLGDHVEGQGRLSLQRPGFIEAMRLVVSAAPSPGEQLHFVGNVVSINCGTGMLQLIDVNNGVLVQLSSATAIMRGNGQAARCKDIHAGDRIFGSGELDPTNANALDATTIIIRHRGQGAGGP